MTRRITGGRKRAYYVGTGLMVAGALLFFSTFVTAAMHFGDFSNFKAQVRSEIFRAVGGMILILAGAFVRGVGARGMAGSGLRLDPEQAAEDLEPYSRQTGRMVRDVLDAADIHLSRGREGAEKQVMIRCRSCRKLNEEDSKFCQECGKPL